MELVIYFGGFPVFWQAQVCLRSWPGTLFEKDFKKRRRPPIVPLTRKVKKKSVGFEDSQVDTKALVFPCEETFIDCDTRLRSHLGTEELGPERAGKGWKWIQGSQPPTICNHLHAGSFCTHSAPIIPISLVITFLVSETTRQNWLMFAVRGIKIGAVGMDRRNLRNPQWDLLWQSCWAIEESTICR